VLRMGCSRCDIPVAFPREKLVQASAYLKKGGFDP
jgi:hypothetical protein